MLKIFKRKEKTSASRPAATPQKTVTEKTPLSTPSIDQPLNERLQNTATNAGDELMTLLSMGTTKKLSKGEYLFKAGMPADTAYVVLDGKINEIAISSDEDSISSYPSKSWITFADLKGSIARQHSARAA